MQTNDHYVVDSQDSLVGSNAHSASMPPIFPYEVDLDVSAPVPTSENTARIYGRFRHFHSTPISLAPGVLGALNLGLLLGRPGEQAPFFEDRMVPTAPTIDPGVWVGVSVGIPRAKIEFGADYKLVLDLVKEGEYWFASHGQPASVFQLRFADGAMSRAPVARPVAPVLLVSPAAPPSTNVIPLASTALTVPSKTDLQVVFDVSDLIQYFNHARLPTGIQRVQIEIITNLILSTSKAFDLKVCCFTKESDGWLDLPLMFFNQICKLASISGDTEAGDWGSALAELKLQLASAQPIIFKQGAYLINLGTSWWLQNYFLHVRAAKARYGIRYVPYVHDCIPIMTPEHCVETLTRDFITWTLGAFQHADHILVNSHATAKDVKFVAQRLGHAIAEPEVVTLDADFRAATLKLTTQAAAHNSEILLRNELTPKSYVLFVSTIESRKNHLMAFSAWLTLAKKHGLARTPKLVCVGNRGWLNDAIYAKLAASKILQEKVTLLSKISDMDLQALYRNCLFTLYPSSYEGWGLPVTESFCYGRAALLANSSSLPEAGGDFADYFELTSEADLLVKLERLMFDAAYREAREKHITESFRPRRWVDIAEQVVAFAGQWARNDRPVVTGKEEFALRGLWPFSAKDGQYYGFTENLETQIWPGMISGELFRQGDGWWWPEPWGCWTKPVVARVAFLAKLPTDRPAVLYIGVKGVQGQDCHATINVVGVAKRVVSLAPDQTRWLAFRVSAAALAGLPQTTEGALFELRFSADKATDFRVATNGEDPRVASVGVHGFMICPRDDIPARLDFIETVIGMNDFAELLGGGSDTL